jgi:BirA family biotin operon repressor/biotin-[acetyl-CoA-carboxylase] ligase
LLEGWSVSGGRFAVSIGIGVNLAAHPSGLAYPATHLAALIGRPVGARAFLESLAPRLAERLAVFARGAGFATIRQQWLAAAAAVVARSGRRARGAVRRARRTRAFAFTHARRDRDDRIR